MGTIREFRCSSCHEGWRVNVGHGMMHGALEQVLKLFPNDIRQMILADTKGEQAPLFNFNFCAAVCSECCNIVVIPVIYLHETDKTYFSGCPECGGLVTLPEKDSEYICPRCKKHQLLIQNIGSWD